MTIEIRELVVRAVVEAPARPGEPPRAAPTPTPAPEHPPVNLDALVARCVREVLRELRRAQGR